LYLVEVPFMAADIERIAQELLLAYDQSAFLAPFSARGPFDLADAYAVGTRLTTLRRARGEQTIGRKIGFTNTTIWEEYGVDRPMWAHVYAHTVVNAPDGVAQLSLASMIAPRIEPEVVFGLRSGIEPGTTAPEALLDTLAWFAPGFEIVDCHFPDWRFTSAECAADFGLHARLVVGPRIELPPRPDPALVDALATFSITLFHNDAPAATGGGANVLGSPLRALAYLVETIAAQQAEPLQAGEVVTTGTLTPALPIRPGATWRSHFEGIGLSDLVLVLTDTAST
jgi:2-oxo-3-hexenedioate decarboxylase